MRWSFENFIYGSIDGAVTTFAIVAGAYGASLAATVILILGIANLIADGFSMAAANYQATKARNEYIEMKRKQEEWEIDNLEDQEKQEIRDIYKNKGFTGDLLDEIVRIITSRRKVWVDTMMKEELGLIPDSSKPLNNTVSTFVGFNLVGLIPLLPFLVAMNLADGINTGTFLISASLTMIAFFIVGMVKGKTVRKSLLRSGLYTSIVGGIAALVAYFVGYSIDLLI